jgi:hypothetical protein
MMMNLLALFSTQFGQEVKGEKSQECAFAQQHADSDGAERLAAGEDSKASETTRGGYQSTDSVHDG